MSAVKPPGLRILIVEDERELGEVFRDYVTSLGYRADVVRSAEAALEQVRKERPHAILLDVKLPGMTGLEFLRQPDVRDANLPIIVVSGYVTEAQARECLRNGAMEFLAKPVPLHVLGTVLEHVSVTATPAERIRPRERRMAARLPVTLPLRAVTERGKTATGTVVEVSATGLRVRLDTNVRPGSPVRLSIELSDGGVPIDVVALVVRTDHDGSTAFWFLDVAPGESERLVACAQQQRAKRQAR